MSVTYLHLPAESVPPTLDGPFPFRAAFVIDQAVDADWRDRVSEWLVRSGCLYAVAWGEACEAWHDSIDWAHLESWNFADIPDDRSMMTTWHSDVPLSEAFWFVAVCASHPTVELERTLIVHVGPEDCAAAMLQAYEDAQREEPYVGP